MFGFRYKNIFEVYPVEVLLSSGSIRMDCWDGIWPRNMCLSRDISVVVICFSVVDPLSFENAQIKWRREAQMKAPDVPIILVGNKSDQRHYANESQVITQKMAEKAKVDMGAVVYIECSAYDFKNVSTVLETAARCVKNQNPEAAGAETQGKLIPTV